MAGRQGRQWLARAMGLALLLQLLLLAPPAEALGWRLPGRGEAVPPRTAADRTRGGQLREVSPPEWVQRAREALEERDPQVRILAPAEGALLPDGPWTLRLEVADWPLVDGGPLGMGPHLVVQLDGQPPRPIVDTTVEMSPLSPGSHLLTVYAAKPWGEAHKSPLALQQRRLHRLAPNPATLPAPGTPQLIPVSPTGLAGAPPLLVDWLLVDAPLQGLRGDASGWRLRLTVNGESVLLDQQVPLWLQGWKPGSNALLLELLDGQGAPLNPPFNSLLREVIVSTPGGSGPPQRPFVPATDLELAVLLGDQPVSALGPSTTEAPPAADEPESAVPSAPPVQSAPSSPLVNGSPAPGTGVPATVPSAPALATATSEPLDPKPQVPEPLDLEPQAPDPPLSPVLRQTPDGGTPPAPNPVPSTGASLSPSSQTLDLGAPAAPPSPPAFPSGSSASASPQPTLISPASPLTPAAPAPEPTAAKLAGIPAPGTAVGPLPPPAAAEVLSEPQPAAEPQPAPAAEPANPPLPAPPSSPEASAHAVEVSPTAHDPSALPPDSLTLSPPPGPIGSSSGVVVPSTGSPAAPPPARAELNPDGTLRRPSRPSPLERLRERLGR